MSIVLEAVLSGDQKGYQKVRQQGLALMEVLLSLGLSSVMFLVLYTAQAHSQRVLIYSQQMHNANGLLDQVANQVLAYPQHYQMLINTSPKSAQGCLQGSYCAPAAMTQAWAAYWQEDLHNQLPNGEFTMACDGRCTYGNTLTLGLTWTQSLATFSESCAKGMACMHLNIAL